MAVLLNISGVTGGGPSYQLTVDSASGVALQDHVSDNVGNLYRVTGIPDSTHLDVEDDIIPDAPEGSPVTGNGSAYAPTTNWKISQAPRSTPSWDEILRRDGRLMDVALPTPDENDALVGTNGSPSSSNKYVTDSDPRNTDARTPSAHDTSHQHGGADEVATATPAANAIPKADGTGKLAAGWITAFNPARVVTMATSTAGADVDNMADALTAAAALVPAPSATDPAAIFVAPGVYSTAPFSAPSFVSIVGMADRNSVVLEASTLTAALVTALADSSLERLTLKGANGAGGVGLEQTAAGSTTVHAITVDDCEKGVHVNGASSVLHVDDIKIEDCDTALEVGASGGNVHGTSLGIENNAAAAMHVVLSAAATVKLSGAIFRDDKVSIAAGANAVIVHLSETPEEESYRVLSELQVGSPEHPKEAIFGEGDSHTRGMIAKTNTNDEAGTWADLSNLYLEDATSDTLFPGTGVGNCFYVGGDLPFSGIKIKITALLIGGVVTPEYWNGSAWTSMNHMSSDAESPYDQYAEELMRRSGNEHIRFGDMTGWATKLLDGFTKYWVRFRVSSTITVSSQADKVKLHTNRTEINKDGVIEHFGTAVFLREITGHLELMVPAGNPGGDNNVNMSTTHSFVVKANRFDNGQARTKGIILTALEGLDTTRPLEMEITWFPLTDEIAGDIEWEVGHVLRAAGDLLDGGNAEDGRVYDITTVPANSQWDLFKTKLLIPVTKAVPGDLLGLLLQRDATAGNLDDTYADHVALATVRISGWFWKGA